MMSKQVKQRKQQHGITYPCDKCSGRGAYVYLDPAVVADEEARAVAFKKQMLELKEKEKGRVRLEEIAALESRLAALKKEEVKDILPSTKKMKKMKKKTKDDPITFKGNIEGSPKAASAE